MRLIQTRPTLIPLRPILRSKSPPDISGIRPTHPMEEAARSLGDTIFVPELVPFAPVKRLVVLIPGCNLDEDALVSKVWKLASAFFLPVLFLGLASDPDHLAFLRRRLAILTARTNYGVLKTGSCVFVGTKWEQAVEENIQPGDLLVCIAELQVSQRVFWHGSQGEALSRRFAVPIYKLQGLEADLPRFQLEKLKGFLALFLTLATIIAFGTFQVWIDEREASGFATAIICLSAILEIITILKVNEWIG
jgi:hypothetical protein